MTDTATKLMKDDKTMIEYNNNNKENNNNNSEKKFTKKQYRAIHGK